MYDKMDSVKPKTKWEVRRPDFGDPDYENGHPQLTSTVSQDYQKIDYERVDVKQPLKKGKKYQDKSKKEQETEIESIYFEA